MKKQIDYRQTLFLLLIALLVSLLFAYVIRGYFAYNGISNDVSARGVLFTVFGVLYAILAGFLLIEVLNRYASLSDTIEQEINSLEDIRDFLIYVDKNKKAVSSIKEALKTYLQSLLDTEWSTMSHPTKQMDSDTSPELYDLMKAVHSPSRRLTKAIRLHYSLLQLK